MPRRLNIVEEIEKVEAQMREDASIPWPIVARLKPTLYLKILEDCLSNETPVLTDRIREIFVEYFSMKEGAGFDLTPNQKAVMKSLSQHWGVTTPEAIRNLIDRAGMAVLRQEMQQASELKRLSGGK